MELDLGDMPNRSKPSATVVKKREPTFDDIEETYFNEKIINKIMDQSNKDENTDDLTSDEPNSLLKEEIIGVYKLLEDQFKDNIENEEEKVDFNDSDTSSPSKSSLVERNQSRDILENMDNDTKSQNSQQYKMMVSMDATPDTDEPNEPTTNILDEVDDSPKEKEEEQNFLLLIDDEHFKPNYNNQTEERKYSDDEIESKEFDEVLNEDEKELGMAPRPERVSNLVKEITVNDFEMIRYLGDGSYGKVNLVKCKLNNEQYALKILDKQKVARYDKIANVMREKDIMFGFDHPNITRLEMTFQDQNSLFFLLEYASNGDLAGLIKKEKRLGIDLIKFYSWEIINALENMRKFNVVHRDLKPENILLDGKWHLKITDFGDSKVIDPEKVNEKILSDTFSPNKPPLDKETVEMDFDSNFDEEGEVKNKDRGESFVGTPLYVSPEMLNYNLAWFSTDLWAFGWILYYMACGAPPFGGFTENQIYEKILSRKIFFPDFLNEDLKDLIDKLLQVHPKDRLGADIGNPENNIDALKAHPFFNSIQFDNIHLNPVPVSKSVRITLRQELKAKIAEGRKAQEYDSQSSTPPKISKSNSETGVHSNKYVNDLHGVEISHSDTMVSSKTEKLNLSIEKSKMSIKKYGPDIVKEELIDKRNKWYFYQARTLRLTKDHRLMYLK